jgi:hypothetical protein
MSWVHSFGKAWSSHLNRKTHDLHSSFSLPFQTIRIMGCASARAWPLLGELGFRRFKLDIMDVQIIN